jgi:hypothetical protein
MEPTVDTAVIRSEAVTTIVDDWPDDAGKPGELVLDEEPAARPKRDAEQPTPPERSGTPKHEDRKEPLPDPDPLPMSPDEQAAARKPIDPEKSREAVSPTTSDPWKEGVERLRALATVRADRPDDGDRLWSIRTRVLDWATGDTLPASETAIWTSVLAPLTLACGPAKADEAALSRSLEEAMEALQTLTPLRIISLQLCRKVQGFGLVEPVDPAAVRAGQAVILYCEVEGLRSEASSDGFATRLASRVEILPPGGSAPVWVQDLGTAHDGCHRRRRDYYVNYRLNLPPTLPSGSYDLRLTQTDLIGERTTSSSLPLTISP